MGGFNSTENFNFFPQKSLLCIIIVIFVFKAKFLPENNRSIIFFSDGRYDTPNHPLFRTLRTDHSGDFYQPSEPRVGAGQGPRQPWQDIHAKVEGPAARDIMINFVERYRMTQQ